MTQQELDALPEDGTFGSRDEMRDGKLIRIPVLFTVGALWSAPDEPEMVRDNTGDYWRVGWAKGVRYKRRMR